MILSHGINEVDFTRSSACSVRFSVFFNVFPLTSWVLALLRMAQPLTDPKQSFAGAV